MRRLIGQVAETIEETRYRDLDQEVLNAFSGIQERNRAATLILADKKLHMAYETLRLTVEFFSDLNRRVLAQIESSHSASRDINLMFGNAILIHEVTDFVILFIERFSLPGDLRDLHRDVLDKIGEARNGQYTLKQKLLRDEAVDESDKSVRQAILEEVENRELALQELEREWADYLAQVGQLDEAVANVRKRIPTLEMIRENAQLQIMTLQLVAMLRVLKLNAESVRGAVSSLQGFRLIPLTPDRVRRLLRV